MKGTAAARLFSNAGIQARKKNAAARRAKVKRLKEKGLSGPQIAAELGVKVRTVYHDFSILNKESESENE